MKHVLLIGCGNMGGALLTRWQSQGLSITVIEPRALARMPDVTHVKTLDDLPAGYHADIVVLAVKPQQMDTLLPELPKHLGKATTYLSIAAGKTLDYYATHLGKDTRVIRAMPNMPALIGKGVTALVGNAHLSTHARNLATRLMEQVGDVVWLQDEAQMDVVTAISGSGPAYFFNFMACLIEAGVKQGLAPELAARLVKQTAIGASALGTESKVGLRDLIAGVVSKGGTTEAALGVFNKDDTLKLLVDEAVQAAAKRSKELV